MNYEHEKQSIKLLSIFILYIKYNMISIFQYILYISIILNFFIIMFLIFLN